MDKNEHNMKNQDIQESTASQPAFSAAQTSDEDTSPLPSIFQGKAIAWIVLLASLVVTFFSWYIARSAVMQSANEHFVFRSQTIEMALRDRLHTCAFLLQSGAGLFAGSEEVTRAKWRTYVTALQIDKHYQGVQGLGFSRRILAAEKSTHIRQIRDEGFPEYEIRPDGERPEYTSIIFLEPFDWRNQRAFGYDMFSEATRREAMMMARDTGLPALSGKVTLLQETEKDVQAGFLMYLPVYRNGEVADTPEQRREALMGYVYSPFRMNDLMQGLLIDKREYVDLQIFDGGEPLQEALLYPSGDMESNLSHPGHAHFATYQSILEYAGRRWLLVFKSSPYFEETIDAGKVNSILLLGTAISLLLFYVLLPLTRSRNQALSLANMTEDLEKANFGLKREIEERKQAAQDLEEAELRFKAVFNATIDGILVADAQTRKFVMGNSAICDMLGYQLEELSCLGIEDIHPAAAFPEVLQQVERQAKGEIHLAPDLPVQRKDGSVFYADVNTTTMVLAGRPILVGVFHDVTERKQIEEKIRQLNDELEDRVQARTQQLEESQALLSTVFDSVKDGIVLMDTETRQFCMSNASLQRMLNYTPDEILGLGVEDILPREEMDNINRQIEQNIKGEISYVPDTPVKRKDGSIFYADINGRVMMVKKTSFLLAVFTDITERKQAEQELREGEENFRQLFEGSRDALMVARPPSWHFTEVNQAALKLFGATSKADFTALGPWDISPERQPDGRSSKEKAQELGMITLREGSLLFEWELRRLNGETFTASVMGTRMGPKGQTFLQATIRDISKEKQTELELLESEKKYRQLFESSRDALMVLKSPSWRFTDVNQATLQMFGATSKADFTALGPWDISTERQPDGSSSAEAAQKLIATAMREGYSFFEWEHQRLNGEPFPSDVFLTRIETGQASVLATVRDITERKQAEEQQRQALLYARSLIEADMDPLVTINMEGRIMDVNEAAIQMTGVQRELLIGSDFSIYFTEPDRALAGYQEAFAKGSVRDYPLTMKHASGALTKVLYNASVYRNEKGEMAGVLAVARDISERLRAELAEEEARRDGLTELYNHRTFHALLKDEIFRTQRFQHQLSLLMLDIDYFKQVNDTYGHQAGDTILKGISELLVKQARSIDRVCRYGGEEITLILPETVATLAMKIAERLRASVELQSFDIGDGKTIKISVSIGVATYPQQANSLEALVKAADLALYAAKQGGRNRVCRYETEMEV